MDSDPFDNKVLKALVRLNMPQLAVLGLGNTDITNDAIRLHKVRTPSLE
jgi:hypothetical protein